MPKIFLDPGHGGNDTGAVGNGLREKDITLSIALEISRILQNEYEGVSVQLSRTKDETVSLAERTRRANSWGADLYVSIHVNAGGGTGFEDYIYHGLSESPKRPAFAMCCMKKLSERLNSATAAKRKPIFMC